MKLIADLQSKIDATILPHTGTESPALVCILDVPNYPNVGDPAILLGELAFLRKHYPDARLMLVSNNHFDEEVASEVERADLIFLHGGGSFGDIWPIHHDFRLRVLSRFAHRQLIQFPQSLHFQNPDVLERTKVAISRAKQYVLIARDSRSHDFALEQFECEVVIAPDMAFCLGPLRSAPPKHDLICLLRTDKERLTGPSTAALDLIKAARIDHQVFDWLKNRNSIERIHYLIDKASSFGLSNRWLARHGAYLFEIYAQSRLEFGKSLLSRGKTVLTDRLHGHIISTLLGKNQIVMDSMDGKVKLFNKTWLSSYSGARFVNSNEELRDCLDDHSFMGGH